MKKSYFKRLLKGTRKSWLRRGMLAIVVVLTYLFFIPGRGFSLEYVYPQGEDCGIQLLSTVTGLSPSVILFKTGGDNWTWWEDFERVFNSLGMEWDYQPLSSRVLQPDKRVILLYQRQWYEVLEFWDLGVFGKDYMVWSKEGNISFKRARDIEGVKVMVVDRL